MTPRTTTSLPLCLCLIWSTASAESMPDQPPPGLSCKCDDDCKNDMYGRHFCYVYSSLGDGWCQHSGPGTPCSKEQGPPLPPEAGPPEQGPGLDPGYQNPEPGYPESDPWYEDMKAVNPSTDGGPAASDGGPAASDGGNTSELTDRGGCSVHQVPTTSWPMGMLLLLALCRLRRKAGL